MRLEWLLLLLLLLQAFVVFDFAVAKNDIDPKAWKPIPNVNDPSLITIANFAVTEFNSDAGLTFKLQKLIKAEIQGEIPNGLYYRFVLAAGDDAASSNNYQVIVWQLPWQNNYMHLVSFLPVHDAPPAY